MSKTVLEVNPCSRTCFPLDTVHRVQSRFSRFCELMSELTSVSLPVLSCPNRICGCAYVKLLKEFCGGLIEKDKPHEWRPLLRRLSSRQRFTVAASLFLFRKVLPAATADLAGYMDKMSRPAGDPDPEFLAFARSSVRRLFRPGWDRSYSKYPERVVLPRSSCYERGRRDGGQREMAVAGLWSFDRSSFCEWVLRASSTVKIGPSRVSVVETGGKNRIVSVPPADMNLLRPLHHCFYDHLSRFPWLLRGDAKPSRFKDFSRVAGEVFVSGDYESATDNLNTDVQEFILREVLSTAEHVPLGVKELAFSSLRMRLESGGKVVQQRRGQLMGNLLSFPLLCLVNFVAFKFAVRRRVPLRINGDDIVFRCRPREAEKWMQVVGRSGLTLSRGKTMVHSRYFSINSVFMEGRRTKGCSWVPFVRSKAFFGVVSEGVLSLRDRFNACSVGFAREQKRVVHRLFLDSNRRFILASRRSVLNGIGLRVDQDLLDCVGLRLREVQFLNTTRDSWVREVPLHDCVKLADPYRLEGWKLARLHDSEQVRRWQKEHAEGVVDLSWKKSLAGTDPPEKELKSLIRDTGFNTSGYVSNFRSMSHRLARVGRMSRNAAFRMLNPYFVLPKPSRVTKVGLVYCPIGVSRCNVQFCSKSGRWKGNDVVVGSTAVPAAAVSEDYVDVFDESTRVSHVVASASDGLVHLDLSWLGERNLMEQDRLPAYDVIDPLFYKTFPPPVWVGWKDPDILC